MKRRIIKQGTSTLTMSLPSSWVKDLNLESGDEVEVIESNKSLIISTDQRVLSRRALLDISGLSDKLVWRYFTALYMCGYDEIVVHFSEVSQLKLLQNIVDDHIGFTIIEQTSKHCIAKEVAQSQPDDFEKLLIRLFHMITTVGKDLLTAVEKNDYDEMQMVWESDYAVNKIAGYCIRMLNKFGYPLKQNVLCLDDIVRNMERVADSYKHIAKVVISKKGKVSKETLRMFQETTEVMQDFFHLYFHFDKEHLIMVYQRKNALAKRVEDSLNIQKGIDILVLGELKRAIIILSGISQSIMALNVETEDTIVKKEEVKQKYEKSEEKKRDDKKKSRKKERIFY